MAGRRATAAERRAEPRANVLEASPCACMARRRRHASGCAPDAACAARSAFQETSSRRAPRRTPGARRRGHRGGAGVGGEELVPGRGGGDAGLEEGGVGPRGGDGEVVVAHAQRRRRLWPRGIRGGPVSMDLPILWVAEVAAGAAPTSPPFAGNPQPQLVSYLPPLSMAAGLNRRRATEEEGGGGAMAAGKKKKKMADTMLGRVGLTSWLSC